MALDHTVDQPGAVDITDPVNYPQGKAQNEGGLVQGTAWIESLINDLFGWQQALILESGNTISGNPDTAQNSDYLTAMRDIAAADLLAGPTLLSATINASTLNNPILVNAAIDLASIMSASQLSIAQGGTGQSSSLAAFNALKQSATEVLSGVLAIATQGQTDTGSDDSTVVTPSKLRGTDLIKPFAGSTPTVVGSVSDSLSAGVGISMVDDAGTGTVRVSNTGLTVDVSGTDVTLTMPTLGGISIVPVGMYMSSYINPFAGSLILQHLFGGTWRGVEPILSDETFTVISNGADTRFLAIGGVPGQNVSVRLTTMYS